MKPTPMFLAVPCLLVLLSVPSVAQAQQEWHHVHLNTTDHEAARAWYIEHMGAEPRGSTGARSGSTAINLWETEGAFEGTVGSSVDHIGFSFPDLGVKLAELRSAGLEIVAEAREVRGIKSAFVADPWGTKIEILEDDELLGFHHVHLLMDEVESALAWFVEMFGGERADFEDLVPAVDYGDMWLMVSPNRTDAPLASTLGRSLDHIGYTVVDIDGELERMVDRGVDLLEGPRPSRGGGATVAYVMGPEGVRIELLQPGGG